MKNDRDEIPPLGDDEDRGMAAAVVDVALISILIIAIGAFVWLVMTRG